jgi:3-hydroxybutyryl-CoA dehydrogenase
MKKEGIKKVAVVGTGTLGSQIALMASYHGCEVKTYDIDDQAFPRILKVLKMRIQNSGRKPFPAFMDVDAGAATVRQCSKLDEALKGTELVIEAVPEDLELKRKVFKEMDLLSPREAILATNSSSIPVSRIEGSTRRPEKCLNLHFYSLDQGKNIVDIMGGSKTTPETLAAGREWVESIGCVPLTVNKEILGFCFNRVWRAVKKETLHMWADGYVDFRDIDRGWMISYGTALGPFGSMDAIGLDVVYGIEMVYYNESKNPGDCPPDALKKMIERNELGVKTGKGFYSYPNPEYKNPDFLKGKKGSK